MSMLVLFPRNPSAECFAITRKKTAQLRPLLVIVFNSSVCHSSITSAGSTCDITCGHRSLQTHVLSHALVPVVWTPLTFKWHSRSFRITNCIIELNGGKLTIFLISFIERIQNDVPDDVMRYAKSNDFKCRSISVGEVTFKQPALGVQKWRLAKEWNVNK